MDIQINNNSSKVAETLEAGQTQIICIYILLSTSFYSYTYKITDGWKRKK